MKARALVHGVVVFVVLFFEKVILAEKLHCLADVFVGNTDFERVLRGYF